MKTIAVIGAGNMGSALIRGMIDTGYVKPEQLYVCDHQREKLEDLAMELPAVNYCEHAVDAVEPADVVLVAIKPYNIAALYADIGPFLAGKAVVSIAAGWNNQMISTALKDTGATWLRVMPNTPALVGEGMTALCAENTLSEEDFAFVKGMFESVGRTAVVAEKLFDAVIAVSGSSPAYIYMLIEAMADAAVQEGMTRSMAIEMAAQSVLGSALMVLSTGEHPAKLKDAVCSPGGTTIDAVVQLETHGFRAAVMAAMDACAAKSKAMTK